MWERGCRIRCSKLKVLQLMGCLAQRKSEQQSLFMHLHSYEKGSTQVAFLWPELLIEKRHLSLNLESAQCERNWLNKDIYPGFRTESQTAAHNTLRALGPDSRAWHPSIPVYVRKTNRTHQQQSTSLRNLSFAPSTQHVLPELGANHASRGMLRERELS